MQIFKFTPIYKETIWGGERLATLKGIRKRNLGETWELTSVGKDKSVVCNGENIGLNINKLIAKYKEKLVGERCFKTFGCNFPLLFKFIDAQTDLSIQVHPSDEMAKRIEGKQGKTEMWYVVDCAEGADIIVGHKPNVSLLDIQQSLNNDTIVSHLNIYPISKGDSYYIPSGVVHAIRKGTLIAEIQQASDITYRLYDYSRCDSKGQKRALHLDKAFEAINFSITDSLKINYSTQLNTPSLMVDTPFFKTRIIHVKNEVLIDYMQYTSFIVLMCVDGSCDIIDNMGNTEVFTQCETILLAADIQYMTIKGKATLLETTF